VFESNSRYAGLPVLYWQGPDGRAIPYVGRRFCPQGGVLPLLVEVTTIQGQRLDQLATQTLGDALQYWRICDANDAMNPAALAGVPGRRLRVPVPYAQALGAVTAPPLALDDQVDGGAAGTPPLATGPATGTP
jgi:hypothetical protein